MFVRTVGSSKSPAAVSAAQQWLVKIASMPFHTIHMTDHQTIGYHVERLKRGWRWCTIDGLPNIHPAASEGTVECPNCSGSNQEPVYCRKCGEFLSKERREFYKKKRHSPCRECFECVRGWTKPHLIFGVKVPHDWHDPNAIVHRSRPSQHGGFQAGEDLDNLFR